MPNNKIYKMQYSITAQSSYRKIIVFSKTTIRLASSREIKVNP